MKRRRTSKSSKPKIPRAKPSRQRRIASTQSARQKATHQRAVKALALMRRGKSMSVACRSEHIKPDTLRRYVGKAVRRETPTGRFRAAPVDRLVRSLQIRTEDGELVTVLVRSLRAARELSSYENAVGRLLRTGHAPDLSRFEGKTVVTEDGRRVALVTDPDRLRTLAAAGLLRLDGLYR